MRTPLTAMSTVALLFSIAGGYIANHGNLQLAELRAEVHGLAQKAEEQGRIDAAQKRHEDSTVAFSQAPLQTTLSPTIAAPTSRDSAASARQLPTSGEKQTVPAPKPTEIRDQFEVIFDHEPSDPSWAVSAYRTAQDRLPAALPKGSEVRSVECRSSMCRIETSHSDGNHYREFMRDAMMSPDTQLWNGGFFSAVVSDQPGQFISVTFLSREGQALKSSFNADGSL